MLGLVPLGGESVGSADEESITLELESFGRLEPSLESLLREILTHSLE